MESTPAQFDDGSIWERNLLAIRRRWPGIAESLASHAESAPSSVVELDSAASIISRVTPSGACTEPLLIAGADLAVWAAVYQLPCKMPNMPTHRPPLYFLARQASDLLALHALDCVAMFTDPRTQLFLGEDAVRQFQDFQFTNPQIPAAQTSITIDPMLFRDGLAAENLYAEHLNRCTAELESLERELNGLTSRLLSEPQPKQLRVLGISSRYTTFLQHSMRDWLESLRALGHETEFVIESFDHEMANPLSMAQVSLQFRPDLIVMIDHYRQELRGVPKNVPFVMWVQDELSHIFCSAAGVAQGVLDFCLGFGRLHLRDKCGYPEQRFMTTPVGVNIRRFAPASIKAEPTCDLSFVSNASAPATTLLEGQLQRADAGARKVLIEIFDWLKGTYEAGGYITHLSLISRFIDSTLDRHGVKLNPQQRQGVDEFFITKINNALFRHQTLSWAAATGLRMELWGRGWEQHGRLRRFAKGVACNQSQLCDVYQRSAINLQIVPTGAVHQRLLDGVAAGGFFLLRGTAGDRVEPLYRKLISLCKPFGFTTTAELQATRVPAIVQTLEAIQRLLGVSPFELPGDLMDVLNLSIDCGFVRSAAAVWENYETVAFDTREGFNANVQQYLNDADARHAMAAEMRQIVIERFSYDAINDRLLQLIRSQLGSSATTNVAAAA